MQKIKNYKNKILLLILWLFILSPNLYSNNHINNFINSDTTLQKSQSPYIITDDLTVDTNVTLTIEAGTVLKFDENTTLHNYGQIIAIGTSNDTILFTSNLSSQNKGDWEGIIFYNTENSGQSDLEYVQIEYSDTAITFENVSCTFSYLNIVNNNVGVDINGNVIVKINHSNFYFNENENVISNSNLTQDFIDNYWGFTFQNKIKKKFKVAFEHFDYHPILPTSSWTNDAVGPKDPYIMINNHDAVTYRDTVTLTLSVENTATEMIISEDEDFSDADWESFAETKEFVLSSDEGNKKIYVIFRDEKFYESAIAFDEIYLVKTGPQPGPTHITALELLYNDTWTVFSGPYIIENNYLIPPNIKLTIEPGVEIRFQDDVELVIDGTLHAVGTSDSQILFTSNNESKSKGDWKWLRFRSRSINNIFSYCKIEYGTQGIIVENSTAVITNSVIENHNDIGIEGINGSSFTIENIILRNNSGHGLYADGGNHSIDSSVIELNTSYGINIRNAGTFNLNNSYIRNNNSYGVYINSSNSTITNNKINDNGNMGLYVNSGTPIIDNNIIKNNNSNGMRLHQCPNFEITNCTILNNSNHGIYITSNQIGGLIENCFIENNAGWGIYGLHAGDWPTSLRHGPRDVIVKNNIIKNNEQGIYFGSHSSGYQTSGIIENNIIKNNLQGNGDAIHISDGNFTIISNEIINFKRYGIYTLRREATIKNNEIDTGTGWGIYVNGSSGTINDNLLNNCNEGIYNSGNMTISQNIINTTGNQYGIRNLGNSTINQNTINTTGSGIGLENTGTSTISQNIINNFDLGLRNTGNSTITYNTIKSCTKGIFNNTDNSTFNFNEIYEISELLMDNQSSYISIIDAEYNYWGSVDAEWIREKMIDYYNDPINYGRVNFSRFYDTIPIELNGPQNPSLTINNGDIVTYEYLVNLDLSAIDATEMIISETGTFSDTVWRPYEESCSWIFTPGNELRYLYAKFRNESGTESAVVFDEIFLEVAEEDSGPTYITDKVLLYDKTWTQKGSPYIVTVDYLIPPNIKLTIEPGAEVRFEDDVELVIDGTLHAVGTSDSQILFTSNNESKSKGDWKWLKFRSRSENNIFSYCKIEYGNQGIIVENSTAVITNSVIENHNDTGIEGINGSSFTIENIILRNNSEHGLYADGGNHSIDSSVIELNTNDGIYITNGTTVSISNSYIRNNGRYGIYVNSSNSTITNNKINDNENMGLYVNGGTPVIDNNIIKNNNSNGIRLHQCPNFEITNCTIINNTNHGIYISSNQTGGLIENCFISNNSSFGIDVYGISNSNGPNAIDIRNNTIMNNRNGINFRPFSSFRTASGTIENNILENNNKNNDGSGIQVNRSNISIINNIINNFNNYGIYANLQTVTIENNEIDTGAGWGIYVNGSSGTINNNLLNNCNEGIYNSGNMTINQNIINTTGNEYGIRNLGNSTITQNTINTTGSGIGLENTGTSTISQNIIENFDLGLRNTGNSTITYNTIKRSKKGIFNNTDNSTFNFNEIYEISDLLMENQSSYISIIDAEYNYWGSVDAEWIREKMIDYYNDPINYGRVNFSKFYDTIPIELNGPQNPSLTINNGDIVTYEYLVNLDLSAIDATEMIISETGTFSDTVWRPYEESCSWTFTPGNELRYLYAKFRNESGTESAVVFDEIFLEVAGEDSGPTYITDKVLLYDKTWTQKGSPYIVTVDYLIPPNIKLTVEPGAEVRFEDDVELVIDGTLHAVGTSDSQILFTSNNESKSKGDWKWLKFRSGSINNIFSYCKIEYGTQGIIVESSSAEITNSVIENHNDIGIEGINGSSFTIENIILRNNSGHGLYADGGNHNIDSSVIELNTTDGIYITNGTTVSISNSYIRNNARYGIYVNSSNSTITNNEIKYNMNMGLYVNGGTPIIDNNIIKNNTSNGMQLHQCPNFEITNCTILNNSNHGIYITSNQTGGLIENCLIENNTGWGIYGHHPGTSPTSLRHGPRDVIVKNNIIKNNEQGIYFRSHSSGYQTSGIIENNIIKNNLQGNGDAIRISDGNFTVIANKIINFKRYGIYTLRREATIKNNEIDTGSGWGIYIDGSSGIIINNIVKNCNNGLYNSGNSTIAQNTINTTGNGIGLENTGTSTISQNIIKNANLGLINTGNLTATQNTIKNCTTGIHNTNNNSTFNFNNIHDNATLLMDNRSHYESIINAKYNYWGSADASWIRANSIDYFNDPINFGRIDFSPYFGDVTIGTQIGPTNPFISINDGAELTDTPNVTLTISADGAYQMMLSETYTFQGANWEPYITSMYYMFSGQEGDKRIYIKFRNTSLVQSAIAFAEIELKYPPGAMPNPAIFPVMTPTNIDTQIIRGWKDSSAETLTVITPTEYFPNAVHTDSTHWQVEVALDIGVNTVAVIAKDDDRASDTMYVYIIFDTYPPAPPQEVIFIQADTYLLLNWDMPSDTYSGINSFDIYRKDTDIFYFLDNVANTEYFDYSVTIGETYSYYFVTIDGALNRSDSSVKFDTYFRGTEHPPVFTDNPDTQIYQYSNFIYTLHATDFNLDKIVYDLYQAPDNMSIDTETGLITWIPDKEEYFDVNQIIVSASDHIFTVYDTFYINVLFDTFPPSSVDLISPIDDIFDTIVFQFEWTESSDTRSGIDYYRLEIYNSPIFNHTNLVFYSEVSDTCYNNQFEFSEGYYYWQVVVYDRAGNFSLSSDTAEFYMNFEPIIQINYPPALYDTNVKYINVSGTVDNITKDGSDTVVIYLNSVKQDTVIAITDETGFWIFENIKLTGVADTVYVELTDRFSRVIISDSIVINYYVYPEMTIDFVETSYENPHDTNVNQIIFNGMSDGTKSGDTITVYVNNDKQIDTAFDFSATDNVWELPEIYLDDFLNTVVIKITDNWDRITFDTIYIYYYPPSNLTITNPENNHDTNISKINICIQTDTSHSGDTLSIYRIVDGNFELQSHILLTENNISWSGTTSLSGVGETIVAVLENRLADTVYKSIVVNYYEEPSIQIIQPLSISDTKNQYITITGKTHNVKNDGNDTVVIYLNSVKQDTIVGVYSETGLWQIKNIKLNGLGDSIYVVLTDRFSRTAISDFIVINYYENPSIQINQPLSISDTKSKFINVSGIVNNVGYDGLDTVSLYLNSIKQDTVVVITDQEGKWILEDIKLTDVRDTVYVVLTDRFSRTIISGYIIVNYYVQPEIKIDFVHTTFDNPFDTNINSIILSGTSIGTKRNDKITVYVNNEKQNEISYNFNQSNMNWVSPEIFFDDYLNTVVIEITDNWGRNTYDTAYFYYHPNLILTITNPENNHDTNLSEIKISIQTENAYPNDTITIHRIIDGVFEMQSYSVLQQKNLLLTGTTSLSGFGDSIIVILQNRFGDSVYQSIAVNYHETPPATTHNIPDTWLNEDFEVVLSVSDTNTVAATYYKINDGTFQTGNFFTVTTPGTNTIKYYSTDIGGNIEDIKTAILRLDKTPPVIKNVIRETMDADKKLKDISSPYYNISAIINDNFSGLASIPVLEYHIGKSLTDYSYSIEMETSVITDLFRYTIFKDSWKKYSGDSLFVKISAIDNFGNIGVYEFQDFVTPVDDTPVAFIKYADDKITNNDVYTVFQSISLKLSAEESYSLGSNVFTYYWDLGDGNYSTHESLVHNYSLSDTYHITLAVSNIYGATDTAYLTLIIANKPPNLVLDIGASNQLFAGEKRIFDASNSYDIDGNIDTFIWYISSQPDSVFHSETFIFIPTKTGLDTVSLKVFDNHDDYSETTALINVRLPNTSLKTTLTTDRPDNFYYNLSNQPVNVSVEIQNLESLPINKNSLKIVLPKHSFYKDGSFSVEPSNIMLENNETQIIYDIGKLNIDTKMLITFDVEIDTSDSAIGKILEFKSYLFVDELLINTSDTVTLEIISSIPAPPRNLSFQDYKNLSGKIEWAKSTSDNVISYSIYWDSGTGIINYDTPLAVIDSDTLFFRIENLVHNEYRFVVRSKNDLSVEEKNRNMLIVIPDTTPIVELPNIIITAPQQNQKVSGNNFLFKAEVPDWYERTFESTQWRPRASIENSAKTNPDKKGNPNDYMEFIDVGNQTIVNVYTSEINPYLFLDENFVSITPNNPNNAVEYQLVYQDVVDSGYLWSVTVPNIHHGDRIYISQRGSRPKNFTNLNIKVEFQIRKLSDNGSSSNLNSSLYEWHSVVSNNPSSMPNPAISHPWLVSADLNNYPNGDYVVRTKIYYLHQGTESFTTNNVTNFTIDHENWEVSVSSVNNKTVTKQNFTPDIPVTVNSAGIDNNNNRRNSISVAVPENIVDSSLVNGNLQMQISQRSKYDTDVEAALNSLNRELASIPFEINLISGSTNFNFFNEDKYITIEISYNDEDGDGFIDGTDIRINDLTLMTYSTTTDEWEECEIISVNRENNTARGKGRHLSFFMLTGSAVASTPDNIIVRPNPFNPNDGDRMTGRNYDGSEQSGIWFENLPAYSIIKIYSLRGTLVSEITLNNTNKGTAQWDVRNDKGQEVASGVYVYVVSSPVGKRTGKFVIIR